MPRLVLLVTLCALLLGAAAILFRGESSLALGSPTDSHAAREALPTDAEPTILAPPAKAPRQPREVERGSGRATLRTSVHLEGGAAVPGTPVQVIGATWRSAITDDNGIAHFELAPGEAEVLVPARDGDAFVPRYAPEGQSNRFLDLRPGEARDVQLLVYRGSVLEVDLRDAAGVPLEGRRVNLHRRERAGWSESEPYTTDARGRIDLLGLGPGSYLLEQGRHGPLWFPPFRVDLVAGERRRAALVADSLGKVEFGVRVVRAGSGEVLPLNVSARLYPRARADEPTPPDHEIRRVGWPQPDGRIQAQLHARRYEIEFKARGVLGDRTQLVAPTLSRATIEVGPNGRAEPAEVEVVAADIGPLAIVHARIETELDENEFAVGAQMTGRTGNPERLWMLPGTDGNVVVVVDLELLLDRRMAFVLLRGEGPVPLGALELVAGEQTITLEVPDR